MAKLTAGQTVVDTLRAHGVRYIYGLVGSSFIEVMDAMWGAEDIKFVGARHEQAAGFMALGQALATGEAGVCMAQNGPGVTNLLTPVAAAKFTHAPLVVLAGAPMSSQLYKDSFQELDQKAIFAPVCKSVMHVTHAHRIPEILSHAFRIAASGRKGPVLVDLPRDLLNERGLDIAPPPPIATKPQRIQGDPALIDEALALMKRSQRPIIVAGWGVMWSGAGEEVEELASVLNAGIVTSYERNDAVRNSHPCYVGGLGRAGAAEAREAAQRADLVIAIGTRLGHFTTFYNNRYIPEGAKIIQVELNPEELGRQFPITVGIWGDAKSVAQAWLAGLSAKETYKKEEWGQEVAGLRRQRLSRLEQEGVISSPMKPQLFYHAMRKLLKGDEAIVLDAGAGAAYGYDRIAFESPRSLFTSGELGCIGAAFPIALGVKMAQPHRAVISISGDGGFFMNAHDLETAVRWKIPTVNFVLNNNSWGSEKAYQKHLYGERYMEADIGNPRFDKLAELCGAAGFYVSNVKDLPAVFKKAMSLQRPSVIEVAIDPDELPYPARAEDVFRK
ncbi:MAG: thiamine pyrophosphate-binding protein [SAR202 cluster bacterium]|nr:thiamine pyrophosphate-binding protein [SAR202 cluster bacterium]